MPKYVVTETRMYDFSQVVEASSQEEAIQIAQDTAYWEQDENYVDYEYSAAEVTE